MTYGVFHQAGVLVQPEAQNSSSFTVVLITIQSPGLGEFHGFWVFSVYLENTWVKCFRFQPQAPSLDCPEVKVPCAY